MKFIILALAAFFISFSSLDAYELCDTTHLCLESSEGELERKSFSDNNEDNELLFYGFVLSSFKQNIFKREDFRYRIHKKYLLLKPPPNLSVKTLLS